MRADEELRVCELQRRGKLVTADPWFEDGPPVAIESRSAREVNDGDLALVRVPPRGRGYVVEPVGPASLIESVLHGLMLERGARWPSEHNAKAAIEASAVATEPVDHDGRVDLRALPTLTIDPDTARDFDDAISVVSEESGWRVWVHIADVAAYVRPGTALDDWAGSRAFSTYVPGQVSPMLPEALSAGACSLQAERDRWCLTVELALSDDASVRGTSFYRSVINSDARLTYAEAAKILAGESTSLTDAVTATVRRAATVSEALRELRFARGAMRLERPELAVELDGEGGVAGVRWEAEPDAHGLIEELMIVANEAVARFLRDTDSETLYRVHPDPEPQAVAALISKLAAIGVPTPPQPEQLTPKAAAKLAALISDRVATHIEQRGGGAETYTSLILRALERARYETTNRGHSGLASPAYCHFTSPIRRFPDLICHRALLARLGLDNVAPGSELAEVAEHCSGRERTLAKIEHEANDICLAWLLDTRLYDEGWETAFDGEVVGVIGSGLFVRFGDVFEGYVPARTIDGDYFELDELGVSLVGRRSGRQIELGAATEVRVERIDKRTGNVQLALA